MERFEGKEKLFYIRKILVLATAAYLLFGLFYRTYPGLTDPMSLNQRILAASVFLIIYLLSYFLDKVKNNVEKYFYFTVYFANLHLIYLAYQNKITLNYAFSIIIVIGICNILIKSQKELKRFNIIMVILVSFTTIYTIEPRVNEFVFLAVFYIIVLASYIISKLGYLNVKNIKDKKTYYKKLFDKSPVGLLKCDSNGNILDINQYMLELSDKDNKEFFIGKNIFDLINIERFNLDEAEKKEYLESKVNFQWETELWVDYSVEKVLEGKINQYIIAFKDITSRKALEKRLTYLSYKDKMTGLYNYRYFMKELDKLDSSRKIPISILVTDIDELKTINDQKGHIFGNKIIKKTAEILKDSVREEDTLARFGGDEFAVLLPNTDSKTAEKVGKRINSKLEEYNKNRPQDERISLSIGWGTKESNQTSLKEILEYADLKMYDVKNLSN